MIAYLDLIMFAALMAVILMGFPVAFTIGGVAVLFAIAGIVTGVLDPKGPWSPEPCLAL